MKKKEKWFDSSIMKADESKTTENTRHFVLNNGTRKAVFSPQNINYYDHAKNEWKPIDNSLKATDEGYLANLGKYTAKLSKNTDNETVEISAGSDLISWEYLGINKNVFYSLGKTIDKSNVKRKSKLNVKANIKDNLNLAHSSRAIYANAEGNVDLDYSIEGNGIKENIVIKEKSDSYHYYFLLRVVGFEMKTAKDGTSLEFYKPITNIENSESRIPEFIMPAPFMYDANGNRSNRVKYALEKIEEGVYIFSIEADSEWINASDRIFPVCIDPQLLTVSGLHITVTHEEYQWCDCSDCGDCSCCESYWMHIGNPYYSYIYLYNDGTYKTTAKLRIKNSNIDLTRNRLISAKLIFPRYLSYPSSACIEIGDSTYCHDNESELIADITSIYNAASKDFDITMSLSSVGTARSFYIPTLQIEYQPICDDPIRKTFSLENGASAEFDVLSGNTTVTFDDINDPVLGVAVSHVYKPNDSITEYGQNFRLNLDEKLVKTNVTTTGAQYAYTDSLGDVHTFNEHFYKIGTNGEKEFFSSDISSITADADGRLWLNGKEVFRELTTDRGLRASARIEGTINNAEWVEERIDEEKQLEEQVKSYKDTLCNFSSINKKEGTTTSIMTESKLSSPDSVEAFLSEIGCSTHLLLSKEEALSYKSLLTQKKSLSISISSLVLQKSSLTDNAKSLLLQVQSTESTTYQKAACNAQSTSLDIEYDSLVNAINKIDKDGVNDEEVTDRSISVRQLNHISTQRVLLESNQDLIDDQAEDLSDQKEHIRSQIRNFPITNAPTGSNGTLTRQYYNVENQIDFIDVQMNDIKSQIALYESKSSKYISQFKSYYKEYLNLKNRLDILKTQVPVAYLISDSAIKGFNENGDLVIIQDKYGRYVVVEREKYTSSGAMKISAVYDQDSKAMIFSYNENNKLSEICNSLGERVAFKYDTSGYLTSIERDNQPTLTLYYSTVASVKRIGSVESANNTAAILSYDLSGMLKYIAHSTAVNGIAHDNVVTGSGSVVSIMDVEYTYGETKLIYNGIKQEIYKIDQTTEQVTAHYEIINGLVTGAECYTYSDYLLTKTERASKSCLNRYPYNIFAAKMQIETVEDVTYNSFKEPTTVVTSKYALPRTDCDCPTEQTTVEYTYNDNRKLVEKKTTHSYYDCCEAYDTTVAVEKYYYDNAGELVRKESYVEGEELKIGINIEEHVFNDKGMEIKSFSYNSLDPSSKFYTENEVDENGKVLCAFDESGEHKTVFDYERDGVTVKTERLPNGSKFSYGRDKDGTVTAITHSTESGEENSTTQLRTLDVVTEIKSGNNTVRYAYDKKRRVKAVSLNGVDDYVTYNYSGEHTDAEKITATMGTGTDCEIISEIIKNAHGNVTKSTYGNRTVTNTYNSDQQLTKTLDSVSGETTITYDGEGNITTVTAPDHSEEFAYDEKKTKLESKTVTGDGINHTYEYSYKATADKSLDSITVDGKTVRPNTDVLGRNVGKTIEVEDNKIAEEKISYVKFGDHATNLPSTVRFATNGVFNDSIKYKYDSMGNIVEIFENGRSACRYEYDSLGRLTREDNVAFGKTTTWGYDNNGNIIARYEYSITTKPTSELHLLNGTCKLYTYDDNSDQLISYNGETFVYDTIGNPTTYRGKTAVWESGRQLTSFDGNTFAYDARGRRTAKNGITFTYDSNGNLIKQSNGLEFLYDHTGVFAVKHNNATYFYRKNAQNDIIALLDNTGAVVVKYKYDAWGKCNTFVLDESATEIATLNPFRYRSYYYDTETGFYFLKTRYYDPEIGRFMTIDDISYLDPESINGLNLYAYCGNNPVMNIDPIGKAFLSALIISIIVGAVISGTISGVTAYNEGVRGIGLVGSILGGAIMGAAMGAILTIGGAAGLTSLAVNVAGYTLTSAWAALGISVAIGVGAGVASYSIENGLREDRTLSVKGFIFAGLSGGLKGAATFVIGFVGGKFGAFDKMFLNDILKGAYTISTFTTYELAKGIMASAFPSIGRTILTTSSFYIGEFLTKLLFVSSAAAASRWIIDQFFDSLF